MVARVTQSQHNNHSKRDGDRKKTLGEVEFERRVGYAWYNETPAKLIAEDYKKWSEKWALNK